MRLQRQKVRIEDSDLQLKKLLLQQHLHVDAASISSSSSRCVRWCWGSPLIDCQLLSDLQSSVIPGLTGSHDRVALYTKTFCLQHVELSPAAADATAASAV